MQYLPFKLFHKSVLNSIALKIKVEQHAFFTLKHGKALSCPETHHIPYLLSFKSVFASCPACSPSTFIAGCGF